METQNLSCHRETDRFCVVLLQMLICIVALKFIFDHITSIRGIFRGYRHFMLNSFLIFCLTLSDLEHSFTYSAGYS